MGWKFGEFRRLRYNYGGYFADTRNYSGKRGLDFADSGAKF
jgi:hypothetical protein